MKNLNVKVSNEVLQWIGTAFILAMYVVSNFFKGYDDLRNSFALIGALFFLVWSLRVRNRPQLVVNVIALTFCVVGFVA